jgi:glycosyltransferase involved in cell wall biosynthesis
VSAIDVIIPCYKYAHYLRACVKSVLTQPGVELRVLIIDDESPDNTLAVATELALGDPRVEVRRHLRNQGFIATLNEGLTWAQATYTMILSADDLLTPGALGRAVRLLDDHPEVGFTYGRAITFQAEPPVLPAAPDQDGYAATVRSGQDFIELVCGMTDNPVRTPTVVVRTQLQKALGGYRPELPHTADLEMWLRFAAHASVGYIDAAQAFYRWHGQNMSLQCWDRGDLEQCHAAFQLLFREHGARIAGREGLQARVSAELGDMAFGRASRAFDQGDLPACQRFLDLAAAICPALASSWEWAKLRWKRRLGRRTWSVLQPVVQRLRWRRRLGTAVRSLWRRLAGRPQVGS